MKFKSVILSSLGVLPVVAAGGMVEANAQQPGTAQSRVYNWTGYYIGVNGGYLRDTSKGTTGGSNNGAPWCWNDDCNYGGNKQSASGFLGGAQIGANWQNGAIVTGLEADLGWSNAKKDVQNGLLFEDRQAHITGIEWFGTARARLGFDAGAVMPYITGGMAFAKLRNTHQAYDDSYTWSGGTGWRSGWTLGGGVEYMFAPNSSLKVEGLYYDLGTKQVSSIDPSGDPYILNDKTTGFVVRGGINYRFGR